MHRDVVSHYRIKHFESLDCIINTIEDRFVQEDFRTYVKLENLLQKLSLITMSTMMLGQYTAVTWLKIDFKYS